MSKFINEFDSCSFELEKGDIVFIDDFGYYMVATTDGITYNLINIDTDAGHYFTTSRKLDDLSSYVQRYKHRLYKNSEIVLAMRRKEVE
jgi:hypothetical protein